MIPAPTGQGWFLIALPPTAYSPPKLVKVRVRDGAIVQAYANEARPHAPGLPARRLHWAAGVGGWAEA